MPSNVASGYCGRIEQGIDIERFGRRAYPADVLGERQTFFGIEAEEEETVNMALSVEEMNVIKSARVPGGFPLFINGRAGSGKSTILQYLFADIIIRWFRENNSEQEAEAMASPIYLTSSKILLEEARKRVEKILHSELRVQESATRAAVARALEKGGLRQFFDNFQNYLATLVSAAPGRGDFFANSRRVTYTHFRKFWNDAFAAVPDAPEAAVCWHVIRSYIKGMITEFGEDTNGSAYLSPSDYKELPKSKKTIKEETYEKIYSSIYPRYEEYLKNNMLWDDQDLVKYILDKDLASAVHPAVFCDEAQDFTTNELELLLRINLFSKRNIKARDVSKIPFVFAGDPFQTINPTGFRWEATKTLFVEKIILTLNPAHGDPTQLNYHELAYNYRSLPPIARFSNTIQALRAACFDITGVEPQIPWEKNAPLNAVIPLPKDANQVELLEQLKKHRMDYQFLVPCHKDGELEFVKKDPFLREVVRIERVGAREIPVGVYSVEYAKGCEFDKVIVYAFGEGRENPLDRPASLRLEYEINNLYVAVSRPRKELVVMENRRDFTRFWGFATDPVLFEEIKSRASRRSEKFLHDSEEPEYPICQPLFKYEGALNSVFTAETLEQRAAGAAKKAREGIETREPYPLEQAILSFRDLGKNNEALECSAHILKIEHKHLEAGMRFLELCAGGGSASRFVENKSLLNEFAVPCFWMAGKPGWEKLLEIARKKPEVGRLRECKWASMLSKQNKTFDEVSDCLRLLENSMSERAFAVELRGEEVWQVALAQVLEFALLAQRTAGETRSLAERLCALFAVGAPLAPDQIVKLANKAGMFEETVRLCEELNLTQCEEYRLAKWETTPYPARLLAGFEYGFYDKVVAVYEEQKARKEQRLTFAQITAVVNSYCRTKHLTEAILLAFGARNSELFRKIAMAAMECNKVGDARTALGFLFISLMTSDSKSDEWEIACGFARENVAGQRAYAPDASWKTDSVRRFVRENYEQIETSFVRSIARSEALPKIEADRQKIFSEFLSKRIRIKDGSWRKDVSIAEAGAAFERAGRHADSIAFYESVLNAGGDLAKFRNFAWERWTLSVKRLISQRRVSATTRNIVDVELEREIRKGEAKWNIRKVENVAVLPDFPNLPPLSLAAEKAPPPGATVPAKKSVAGVPNGKLFEKILKDFVRPDFDAEAAGRNGFPELKEIAFVSDEDEREILEYLVLAADNRLGSKVENIIGEMRQIVKKMKPGIELSKRQKLQKKLTELKARRRELLTHITQTRNANLADNSIKSESSAQTPVETMTNSEAQPPRSEI